MKKILFAGVIGLAILGGCATNELVEAGLPEGFNIVSVDKDNINGYSEILKHKETGCHYVVIHATQAVSVEQMFVEKNGVSVPYCD